MKRTGGERVKKRRKFVLWVRCPAGVADGTGTIRIIAAIHVNTP